MKNVKLKNFGGGTARGLAVVLLALAALPILRSPLCAARIYPSAGTTSAAFLKIGVGARAVGMAGAYTALSDDAYAVYWNPAGLAQPVGKSLVFTHNEYFEGLNQEYFGFTLPGERIGLLRRSRFANGSLGLGLNYFYTPKDLERRSGANEALVAISPVEGKFSAYDLAFSAAYGFNYSRDLRLGGAVKLIRESIDTESGNTAALDLGALYDFPWLDRQFTAGFSVQNLGPGVKFNSKRFDLPLTFKAGLSHRMYERGLLVSMDLDKPVDNYPSVALGLEQPLSSKLALRAGYRYRQYGNELGALSGLAAGLGFVYEQFSFDYAFSPFGDLGATHRISLALRFQPPAVAPAARAPSEPVPAAERLQGARPASYSIVKRPLRVSTRGVDYLVSAAAGEGALALYGLEFKTRLRGGGDVTLDISEGSLPPALAAKLPSGYGQLLAWQVGPGLSGVEGEMSLKFRLPESGGGADAVFYYFTSGGWRKAAASGEGCAGGLCSYLVTAPLSSHYAAAVKK